ncbi:MAG: hypothetical protein ACI9C9_000436 [Marivirga sp.]|jgi:hypothetical protein
MKKVSSVLLLLVCLACATGTSKLIEEEKLSFSYTDEAYLFFRNMRQAQYDRTEMEKEGLRLYQHDDYSEEQLFKTKITVNWRANRAYVLIDLADSTEKIDVKVSYKRAKGEWIEIVPENLRRQGELAFLTDIYNHIQEEHTLFLTFRGQEPKPLFTTADDQEAFRVSMYDFYRMTGVL